MKDNHSWVPITPEAHGHMKISAETSAGYFSGNQLIPVTVREIAKVGADCPIVFVKNPETGQLELVALVGIAPGQNLFVDGDRWQGISRPQVIAVRPLSMRQTPEADQFVLCVDESSASFSAHDGEALFDSSGAPTNFLNQQAERALQYAQAHAHNQNYAATLAGLELLKERSIQVSLAGAEEVSLSGIYLIDDEIFRGLSDEALLILKNKGLLTAIYAQILSMQQLPRLVAMTMAKAT